MAERKASGTASRTGSKGMNIDSALVRELAELLNETGLAEIEVEDGGQRIRLARTPMTPAPAPPAPPLQMAAIPTQAPSPSAPPSDGAAPQSAQDTPAGEPILSPMVGTVYLSSEPGSPTFVKVGDSVAEGDTLVIIEAMKVMNPIIATRDGEVKAVLVDNAQPVEFDQPLVILG